MTVLVAMSGLPGVGKSVIATDLARALRMCMVAIDRIEAPLLRQGIDGDSLGWATYEALTGLAEQQLANGVSVILDAVTWTNRIRNEWARLAEQMGAEYRPIEVVCSDLLLWRNRVEARHSKDSAILTWARVQEARETYWEPWEGIERLVIDSSATRDSILTRAIAYVEQGLDTPTTASP